MDLNHLNSLDRGIDIQDCGLRPIVKRPASKGGEGRVRRRTRDPGDVGSECAFGTALRAAGRGRFP